MYIRKEESTRRPARPLTDAPSQPTPPANNPKRQRRCKDRGEADKKSATLGRKTRDYILHPKEDAAANTHISQGARCTPDTTGEAAYSNGWDRQRDAADSRDSKASDTIPTHRSPTGQNTPKTREKAPKSPMNTHITRQKPAIWDRQQADRHQGFQCI